jgi:Ca2+-transporting ATPase
VHWHTLSIQESFDLLKTNQQGLSTIDAKEKLSEIGPNELEEAKRKSIANILLSQFKDVMIIILLIAALISGIVGELVDAIAIIFILIVNALIGFIQEYRAEKEMQALKQMATTQTKVLRDGNITQLSSTELVPGDSILLEAGNAVPADVRIIESYNLKIEEASLTGESHAIDKVSDKLEIDDLPIGDRKNMAFKGTFVTYGRGSGLVIATGMETELGNIAKMLQEEETLTPLQKRMVSFGKKLTLLVLFLCVLFFIFGWLRNDDLLKLALTSISLAVAAIPEALPAVITISLALAAKRMIRINCLIRKLTAVETLGSVSFICTDKTGTITQNKMHVEQVFVDGQLYDNETLSSVKDQENIMMLLYAFALNNDAVDNENIKGDSTEIALLRTAKEQEIHSDILPRLAEIAFDAERKLMTTFHCYKERIISFTKGAPDILLQKCIDIDIQPIVIQLDEMAMNGQRLLGFAYRYWEEMPENLDPKVQESDLQFLGLAGLIDPPREEVYTAIQECKNAGVVPVMITGDHPLTAKTIAQRIGILSDDNDVVITGQELAALNDDQFLEIVEKVKVYARVSPEQKLRIVKNLQKKGDFVAMTGDGVNDAPSLKRADIGIAMGITGTDVSKEASDMILLDDNFSTIIKAIKEGRRIYDNILKFIKYLMSSNSGELWTLLIGPLFGLPIALLPIQILWINLITDGMPAVSLSYEKAEENIMNRPPRPPAQSVFAEGRAFHIIWVGILMAAIALFAQSIAIKYGLHWQTIVFNVLCFSQMGHLLAIRSQKREILTSSFFANKPLILSVFITLLLQFAVTFTPILQPIFHTQGLSLLEFIGIGFASSLVFFAVGIEKVVFNRYK